MNESSKKVVGELLPQLVMFLGLAIFSGYKAGAAVGFQFAGIAVLAHVLGAPAYYAYLQRKARKEAAKDEQRRQGWEADAPNRAMRLAATRAIVALSTRTH